MMRVCKECGIEIKGRSDKRFCDDQCRSSFHNKRLSLEKKNLYQINSILKRNRLLLQELLSHPNNRCAESDLIRKGFNAQFYTHRIEYNSKLVTYCYDVGYSIEKGRVELYILQEEALESS